MDRGRLGRGLGYGARHAARTLAEAAKAASAPSPAERSRASQVSEARAQSQPQPTAGQSARLPTLEEAGARVMEAHRAVTEAKGRVRTQAAGAGRSMLAPVRKAGGVLWLEMTGSVFALFALFLAPGVWKLRAAVHASPSSSEAQKFYLYLVMLALFVYFAVSSFARAHRRSRRP